MGKFKCHCCCRLLFRFRTGRSSSLQGGSSIHWYRQDLHHRVSHAVSWNQNSFERQRRPTRSHLKGTWLWCIIACICVGWSWSSLLHFNLFIVGSWASLCPMEMATSGYSNLQCPTAVHGSCCSTATGHWDLLRCLRQDWPTQQNATEPWVGEEDKDPDLVAPCQHVNFWYVCCWFVPANGWLSWICWWQWLQDIKGLL